MRYRRLDWQWLNLILLQIHEPFDGTGRAPDTPRWSVEERNPCHFAPLQRLKRVVPHFSKDQTAWMFPVRIAWSPSHYSVQGQQSLLPCSPPRRPNFDFTLSTRQYCPARTSHRRSPQFNETNRKPALLQSTDYLIIWFCEKDHY